MDFRNFRDFVYVRKLKRQSRQDFTRMAIILTFFVISVLISILLPVYMALRSLNGG